MGGRTNYDTVDAFPIKNALFNSTKFYYCFHCIIFFSSQWQIFSVEMTELSSVQLYIWRKREMTVPSWGGKSTQEACDLRVGILGTDREVEWEVSDRLTRVTGAQKKTTPEKKRASSLKRLLSRSKQNLMATNHACFHKMQGPASEVWMASSSHGDQCTPHNLCILQPWGTTLRGARPYSKPSLWEGKKNKTEGASVRSRHMNQK